MEIISTNSPKGNPKGSSQGRNLYIGLLLVAAGVVWLFYNFDIIGTRFFDVFFSWQMLLIAIGGYLLAMKKYVWGTILAAIGAVFLVTELLDVWIPVDKILLPILVIGVGIAFLFPKKN